MMYTAVALFCLLVHVHGHASLMNPVPRNSNDRDLGPWKNGSSPMTPCTCANGIGGLHGERDGCDLGIKENSGRGQPCLWWSQGCSIHCPYCVTTSPDGIIPTEPMYDMNHTLIH